MVFSLCAKHSRYVHLFSGTLSDTWVFRLSLLFFLCVYLLYLFGGSTPTPFSEITNNSYLYCLVFFTEKSVAPYWTYKWVCAYCTEGRILDTTFTMSDMHTCAHTCVCVRLCVYVCHTYINVICIPTNRSSHSISASLFIVQTELCTVLSIILTQVKHPWELLHVLSHDHTLAQWVQLDAIFICKDHW